MAKDYKTVLSNAKDEFVEKRSRFVGYCKPVTCEQEAVDLSTKNAVNIGTQLTMSMPILCVRAT